MENNKKPTLYFLVGLPGSGKSTWAEYQKGVLNAVIHSSDNIRKELGDVNDQSKNELVFTTLHKRVKEDLLNGKNVIYDATNLSRRRRIHFLSNELRDVPCEKICVLFATPFESCIRNNQLRERKVPEDVIKRMYKNFEIPCKQEGFDDIRIFWYDYKKEKIKYNTLLSMIEWSGISQDNHHHSLTIGVHMMQAFKLSRKMTLDPEVSYACLLHDCGKPFCKEFIDSKGNPSEEAHYYSHDNVSSYLSMFYLRKIGFFDEEILRISLLIGLHMRPFLAWEKSENAKAKDLELFGEKVIHDVELLHTCDLQAHQ